MGNEIGKSCISSPEIENGRHYEKDTLPHHQNKLFTLEDLTKPMTIKLNKSQKNVPQIPPGSYTYNQNKRTKCAVLLINSATAKSQNGATIDMKMLTQLFTQFKFKIKTLNKLKTQEMVKSVQTYTRDKNLEDVDMCIVMIIGNVKMSRNVNNLTEISGTDGQFISKLELIQQFKDAQCPQLAGKPKLFLFQGHCCGETNRDDFLDAHKGGFNDMFIANSVLMGDLKEQRIASYYIQALCKVFMTHVCDKDVESMIKLIEEIVFSHNTSTQHTHYENIRFKKCYINVKN